MIQIFVRDTIVVVLPYKYRLIRQTDKNCYICSQMIGMKDVKYPDLEKEI